MKKLLLTLVGIATLALPVMADGGTKIDFRSAPWKFSTSKKEKLPNNTSTRQIPSLTQKKSNARKLAAGPNAFIGGLQSFEDYDWNFSYTDGLFTLYPMEVKKDGDKVTFINMLNYDDEMMSFYGYVSVDVEGVYNETDKTVTIKTPHDSGSEMVPVGKDDYTTYCIVAGRMEMSQDFWPEDELVFHVDGDFDRIYTDQNIGVISVYDDEMGYLEGSYASMIMQPASGKTPLTPASTTMNLGESFPGNEMTGTLQLLNMSDEMITFALAVEENDENLTFDVTYGTVYGLETYFILVTYNAESEGEFSVPVRLSYETAEGECEVTMNVTGTVKANPDFSAVVKEGEFTFSTGNQYPFELKEENPPYVWGPQPGTYQTSWMEAKFEVEPYHTGVLTVKGTAFCTDEDDFYASNTAAVILDSDAESQFETREDADIDLTFTTGPGSHTLRLEYSSGYIFMVNENMGLKLTELSLESVLMDAEGVELVTPVLDFGGLLLNDGKAIKEMPLTIRNMGSEPLSITQIESSDNAFTASIPDGEAALMETLEIPVTFTAESAGEYSAKITVVTTAGPVEAELKATVRDMPDFSVILNDPDNLVKVSTSEENPFVVSEDGYTYNVNASTPDDKETTSTLTFEVTVPENNIAYVSWKGSFSAGEGDTGSLRLSGPSGFDIQIFRGENQDISSDAIYPEGNRLLEMVPGVHTVEFTYSKNGDGNIGGKDMMSISDFTVTMEDFDPLGSELDMKSVRFADCLLPETGNNLYKSYATVYILNKGAGELRVLRYDELDEIKDTAPFGYSDPGYVVHYGSSLMVDLIFYPAVSGDFKGAVTIPTTFGDFDVECFGRAYVPDGMPLIATFDNEEYLDWELVDTTDEENGWFNVKDKYYYRPSLQCFSGDNALMSNGMTEALTESEGFYAVSPVIDVPADGGKLSWWTAPAKVGSEADGYEVYLVEASEYNKENLGSYTSVLTAKVDSSDRSFQETSLDLADYAGKKIRVIFRHKPVADGSGIRLDDVFAFTNAKWNAVNSSAVEDVWSEDEIVETRYYDLSGISIEKPAAGIVLKSVRLKDGSLRTRKTVIL